MTFDDGILKIYGTENGASPGEVPVKKLVNPQSYYYHEETVGITRYYEALKAEQTIERVVSIPQHAAVNINQIAVFEDGVQYRIRMAQPDTDDLGLKIIRLSLERNGDEHEIPD